MPLIKFIPQRSEARSALLARNWWAVLARGVLAVLFGLAALFAPLATLGALVFVFAAYMFCDGILAIVSAVRAAQHHERWGLFVLEGGADLVAGFLAFSMPTVALFVFVILAAAWAIVSGVLMLLAGLQLHKAHGRLWLVLGGVASVIWGVLLGFFPITGLIVLTWWLGAYALIFGFSLVVLGLTLRRRHGAVSAGSPPHAPMPA